MLEKLMMIIGLNDQVTKPLRGITKEVSGAMNSAKSGMQDMAAGGAGLVATGFAIQSALMPAIEMDRKIGEVKSLGVTGESLKQLSKTAIEFSAKYGKSATEFVDSSYKIQSAISTLKGNELSELTRVSGVLAAATKADSETITGYMGQMHKIFNQDAVQMGNVAWAEKIAGQTATVVKMFNTEGKEMAMAFQNFQSIGQKNNIAMEEQFAVLGTLQAITQSGARAGTQYSAFIQGVAKAQGKLGNKVSFQNQDGSMKSVIDIMSQLKKVYGETLDLSEQTKLKKAFGGQQAVDFIMNMMNETDGLNRSIEELQKVSGIKEAEIMASAMTDQWERLESSWFAIRAAAFGMILPSFNAIAESIANGLMWLTSMTDQYPLLTQGMSYAAIVAVSLGGVVAALSLAMGAAKFMASGWGLAIKLLSFSMKASRILTIAWSAAVMIANGDFALMRVILTGTIARVWAWVSATKVGKATTIAWSFATKAFAVSAAFLKGGFTALTTSTWLFNAALWANPITWVIAGIVALVAIVGAMIYWWDDLKASFGDTAVFKMLAATIDWVIDKLNMIPGIDIEWRAGDMPQAPQTEAVARTLNNAAMPTFSQPPTDSLFNYTSSTTEPTLPKNMVQNMTRNQNRETNNVRQYGDVYVTTNEAFSFDQLEEERILSAG